MSNLEVSRAKRLDHAVVDQLPQLSRSFASQLVEEGKVLVNGQPILKAGYKLHGGDMVTILYDPAKEPPVPAIKLRVLYEDADCLVIDKPVGVLTHSKGEFNPEATVATFLRSHIQGMDGSRAGIVHRLDRATSGVMIAAKTPEALAWLQKQFSQRKAKKTYIAIVQGHLKQDEAVIDMPIERNPKAPSTFRVGPNGKKALTHYKVLKASKQYSLLELKPTTGRTHQLRVHLAQLGHPIIGDSMYGGKKSERLFLHARELEITLPDKQRVTFESPLPAVFARTMKADA
ncbi:MAG TPA: RluA family pseudouridine synthase [Patescibacteria group bacterium]|nr:RluA family pseudouridine synthase [Patescibacteria group bacterium]